MFSGMFRPEMLLPMGLPEGVNCIGFGLSLERPTMIKYKIDNIRDLVGHKVSGNLAFCSFVLNFLRYLLKYCTHRGQKCLGISFYKGFNYHDLFSEIFILGELGDGEKESHL